MRYFGLAMIAAAMMVAPTAKADTENIDFYNALADDLGIVQVYDTSDLTFDVLENRNGDIIIEKVIGKVLNDSGDGEVLNMDDEYNHYISYSNVDAKPGDVVLTYFLYNPDTNYEDDILCRFDYVIDSIS